jgi:predicted ATPase
MSLSPVFIVGSPRSGTSILVRSLLRAGYAGFNEGNFLSIIHEIDRAVDRHFQNFGAADPKVLMSHLDREQLKMQLQDVIAAAALKHHPKAPWVDKTGNPEMIEIIPRLQRMFPGARFIFAKRRALENITSRVKKFPGHNFEYHCLDWARNMAAWRKLLQENPGLEVLEVDQRDINSDPETTTCEIADYLQMNGAAASQVQRAFTSERPQQTEPGSADRVLSLATVPWSAEQKATFTRCCGPEMQRNGYTMDLRYRQDN